LFKKSDGEKEGAKTLSTCKKNIPGGALLGTIVIVLDSHRFWLSMARSSGFKG